MFSKIFITKLSLYEAYEVQEEVFYAIAKNNKKILNEYFADYNAIPKELNKKVKDFIETAKKLPRSYFEAKPMQEVSLSQFSHVLAQKDVLSEEQKKKLNEYGIKTIEYDENNLTETLENIDKENKIYFQKSNQVNNKKSFSELSEEEKEQIYEKEYINHNQINNDEKKLSEDIDNHLINNMTFGQMINFGHAPIILQEFGVPDKIMLMSQNKYDCLTERKEIDGHIHHIDDNVMKKIPTLLSNPIMIAYPTSKSKYRGNSRIVVTIDAVDKYKKPINVIIDYDWKGKK